MAATIALGRGDKNLAYMRFGECASLCSTAVGDLFTLRNTYFFQHEQDVRTILNIGYQAAIGMAALSPARHPDDAKMMMNLKAASFDRVNFTPIFGRFRSILNRLPTIATKSAERVKKLAAER